MENLRHQESGQVSPAVIAEVQACYAEACAGHEPKGPRAEFTCNCLRAVHGVAVEEAQDQAGLTPDRRAELVNLWTKHRTMRGAEQQAAASLAA